MPLAKCPHCYREFDFDGSLLDAINLECSGGEKIEIDGWRFSFTGYKTSPYNIDLIGQCVSQPVREGHATYGNKLYLYICCTGGLPQRLLPAEAYDPALVITRLDGMDLRANRSAFRTLKDKAMGDLMQFVIEQEKLNAQAD